VRVNLRVAVCFSQRADFKSLRRGAINKLTPVSYGRTSNANFRQRLFRFRFRDGGRQSIGAYVLVAAVELLRTPLYAGRGAEFGARQSLPVNTPLAVYSDWISVHGLLRRESHCIAARVSVFCLL
jgi:hypothetical protein